MLVPLLFVCLLLLPFGANAAPTLSSGTQTTASPPTNFHPDCADPHNKEVACTVHLASCKDELLPPTAKGQEPPEPHDLRIETFSKATARGKNTHELHVDLSWQMPPKNESSNLKAFRLEIVDPYGKKTCFNFNVSKFSFNEDAASPRFHFTSDSIFDFAKTYTATLFSLPASKEKKPHAVKTKTMPENLHSTIQDPENITEYCKTHSHPEASKWTAGFRKIFLQAITRTIQLEFVGAPPQFCFEEYEVRLLDETGIEVLFFTIIKAAEMKREFIDNKWHSFGEFNFTGLDLDTDYIPSVIPVDTAADGRCLCPTSEQHGACSCIAADWKKVKLHRIQKPTIPVNSTLPAVVIEGKKESHVQTVLYVILILLAVLLLMCGTMVFVVYFCKKLKPVEKTTRIRFANNQMNGGAAVSGGTAEYQSPLIAQCKMTLLIIYSHDGPLHDAAVIAFAELLRTFGFDVHLDAWDMEEIEQNLAEYVNSAVVRADKVVIVNSLGAFLRLKAKHMREDPIERISPSPVDGLFLMQIDAALQHPRVVSVRFDYTQSAATIYSLTPRLQYLVPEHLGYLVASLAGVQRPLRTGEPCVTPAEDAYYSGEMYQSIKQMGQKDDPRLYDKAPEMLKLTTAINKMTEYAKNEPKWFEKLHHRVPQIVETERIAPTTPKKVVQSSKISKIQERTPLISQEEEQEDVQEEVELKKGRPESIPDEPEPGAESGFYSDSMQTIGDDGDLREIERILPQEVLDKPRIRQMAPILEPKDPHHAAEDSNIDSGLYSDLHSAHIAA